MTDQLPVVATLYFKDKVTYSGSSILLGEENPPTDAVSTSASLPEGEPPSLQLQEGRSLRAGRAKSNDLVVQNRNVSRFHAVFSASSSGVVLSDLSSLNGTLVNGTRISTPVDLSTGDVITIGDSEMSIKLSLGEEDHDELSHGQTQTAQLAAVIVSVLVVDICGYTKLSEALPPNDVAQMMHLWFQNVADTVRKYGGEVDKYIGDCVMALWKSSGSDATLRATKAVEAGLEMLKQTHELSQTGPWTHGESFPWRCRVAINTGEALMGTIGGVGKRDFTVLGDTVNVAFRLEGIAGDLGTDFLISAKTASYLKDQFRLKNLGEVAVAGRTGQVEVFTVEGPR